MFRRRRDIVRTEASRCVGNRTWKFVEPREYVSENFN